jgi:hypothetical protein
MRYSPFISSTTLSEGNDGGWAGDGDERELDPPDSVQIITVLDWDERLESPLAREEPFVFQRYPSGCAPSAGIAGPAGVRALMTSETREKFPARFAGGLAATAGSEPSDSTTGTAYARARPAAAP